MASPVVFCDKIFVNIKKVLRFPAEGLHRNLLILLSFFLFYEGIALHNHFAQRELLGVVQENGLPCSGRPVGNRISQALHPKASWWQSPKRFPWLMRKAGRAGPAGTEVSAHGRLPVSLRLRQRIRRYRKICEMPFGK